MRINCEIVVLITFYAGKGPGLVSFTENRCALHIAKAGLFGENYLYEVEAWEVTPGFVRKWIFLLKGREDLIAEHKSTSVTFFSSLFRHSQPLATAI